MREMEEYFDEINDILVQIKDQLSGIAERAEIDLVVSKWNEVVLSKYSTAEQVDITMELVAAFDPDEEQIREALATQQLAPVTLEQAERLRRL
jgi:hypothetical protein